MYSLFVPIWNRAMGFLSRHAVTEYVSGALESQVLDFPRKELSHGSSPTFQVLREGRRRLFN